MGFKHDFFIQATSAILPLFLIPSSALASCSATLLPLGKMPGIPYELVRQLVSRSRPDTGQTVTDPRQENIAIVRDAEPEITGTVREPKTAEDIFVQDVIYFDRIIHQQLISESDKLSLLDDVFLSRMFGYLANEEQRKFIRQNIDLVALEKVIKGGYRNRRLLQFMKEIGDALEDLNESGGDLEIRYPLSYEKGARDTIEGLARTPNTGLYKAVVKTLKQLQTNPRFHPSLQSHRFLTLSAPNGAKVYDSYVTARYRIFWYYNTNAPGIVIKAITDHVDSGRPGI